MLVESFEMGGTTLLLLLLVGWLRREVWMGVGRLAFVFRESVGVVVVMDSFNGCCGCSMFLLFWPNCCFSSCFCCSSSCSLLHDDDGGLVKSNIMAVLALVMVAVPGVAGHSFSSYWRGALAK